MSIQNPQPGFRWLSLILRALLVILVLFVEYFAFGTFNSGFPFWKTALAFTIRSIPSLALVGIFFVALKWEHIAGFSLISFGLMGTLPAGPPGADNHAFYFILGTMIVLGIIFVLNYFVLGNRKTGEEY